MARNSAVKALEELAGMQRAAEANTANVAKILEDTDSPARRDPERAKFAMPEALATAAGAAWLMGPPGILLGIAQGILGKREQQNAIDHYREQSEALNSVNDVIGDELDNMLVQAKTPEDQALVRGLQAELDAVRELTSRQNPVLQELGAERAATLQERMNVVRTDNEIQTIEAQVRDAQAARDLSAQQKSDWLGLVDDFDAQSADYEKTIMAGNQALEMIERGNPVDIVAALIAVNKTLDPTSVVRPEEAKALVAGGDLLEQAQRKLEEWAGTGLPLKADDRRELMKLVQGIQTSATGFQMQRDIRFQGRAVKLDLPSDYVQEFRRVKELPAFKPVGFQEKPGTIQETVAPFSDQNIINSVRDMIGYDGDQRSDEQKQADLLEGLRSIDSR